MKNHNVCCDFKHQVNQINRSCTTSAPTRTPGFVCLVSAFFVGLLLLLSTAAAQAQVTYGISRGVGSVFIINPSTGAATTPAVASNYEVQLGYGSSAMAVSPVNGLLYMIERTAGTTPRIGAWSPATGVATTVATSAAVTGDILRATFCPDGRFYISGNGTGGGVGAEIYQINPTSGALIRTIVVSNVPTNAASSGDIACVTNGDLYVMASQTTGTSTYELYKLSNAQVSTGGTLTSTFVGNLNIDSANTPNGLVEVSPTALPAGCVSPCLLASGAATGQNIFTINSSTGQATTLTTSSGAGLVDLGREFQRDVSVTKTITPTAAIQGRTLTYTINVSNPGPAVAGAVTIVDTLNPAIFAVGSATWICNVTSAGITSTAVTTACSAASGTGNINRTVDLSINSTVQFVVTAPLLSTFTGTVVNSVSANLIGTVFDSSLANNINTVTSTVSPATSLSVTKTNAVTTVTAGQTTAYTVTFSNDGPGNAPGSLIADSPSAGLLCTSATCSATAGAACPPPYTPGPAPAAAFLAGGLSVPTFNANSSLTFVVTCGVAATGQ